MILKKQMHLDKQKTAHCNFGVDQTLCKNKALCYTDILKYLDYRQITLVADKHFIMWGSHIFYQLCGFNLSGSNQDLDCSQFTLAGWRLEEVHPLFTPCTPAMQQSYELKNEKSGGVWEEGTAERTGDQVDEEGRKKTCWDHGHYKTFAIMVKDEQIII